MKATSEQKPFVPAVGDAGNLSSTVINQAYVCHASSQIGIILKKISILTCAGDSCEKKQVYIYFSLVRINIVSRLLLFAE